MKFISSARTCFLIPEKLPSFLVTIRKPTVLNIRGMGIGSKDSRAMVTLEEYLEHFNVHFSDAAKNSFTVLRDGFGEAAFAGVLAEAKLQPVSRTMLANARKYQTELFTEVLSTLQCLRARHICPKICIASAAAKAQRIRSTSGVALQPQHIIMLSLNGHGIACATHAMTHGACISMRLTQSEAFELRAVLVQYGEENTWLELVAAGAVHASEPVTLLACTDANAEHDFRFPVLWAESSYW
ncbi:uncharacterized protein IUM83_07552 [Phytophthora cinnamomi]|uniref:uncharacterized protein n=1 Tax=Phytophthora cinnamomi TaxID=4785 RepID=UPI0035595837|nr:hypothetical protein IUM83_07552 [Phytophthora cinnamomi]